MAQAHCASLPVTIELMDYRDLGDKLQAGIELSLAVFPSPATFLQPSKRALDNPAFGKHGKGAQFVSLGNRYRGPQKVVNGIGKGLSGITAINQHVRHRGQAILMFRKSTKAPFLSVTSAVVMAIAWENPCVSTARYRLMPDTFFPAL